MDTTTNQDPSALQASAGSVNIPYHKHGGADGPLIPINNVAGYLPMVTTTPTFTPTGGLATSVALNSTTGQIYYYDFTNNVWKTTQNLTAPLALRVDSITSSTSISVSTDSYDMLSITALAVGTTISFTGSPTNGQKMIVRILDNGSSQTLAYGASLVSYGVVPPTATIAGKTMTLGFIYDSVSSQWGCVAYVHI